ncbi:MAG: DUF3152 domain-containing protein, partial [Pseudomonadota bacterium]
PASADIASFPDEVGRWACDTPESNVRIRRVSLCRVTTKDGAAEPTEKFGVIRYRVLVEKGLRGLGPSFERRVDQILGLDSGWAGAGVRFVRAGRSFDLSVILAQPSSVDRLCRPLTTRGELSCAMARNAVLNARRWNEGAKTWGANVQGYHHYLVNHEVGHVLGLRHLRCSAEGLPAPVMLQQTIHLKGCLANGFITPTDVNSLMRIMPRLRRRFRGFEPRQVRPNRVTRRRARRKVRSRRRFRARRSVSRRVTRRRTARRRVRRRRR